MYRHLVRHRSQQTQVLYRASHVRQMFSNFNSGNTGLNGLKFAANFPRSLWFPIKQIEMAGPSKQKDEDTLSVGTR